MIKEPFYTSEERKEEYKKSLVYFDFVATKDLLSAPLIVIAKHAYSSDKPEYLARDITCFITRWKHYNFHRLNEFSGYDCIRWEFVDFQTKENAANHEDVLLMGESVKVNLPNAEIVSRSGGHLGEWECSGSIEEIRPDGYIVDFGKELVDIVWTREELKRDV